jgi:hypothetical protein
LFVWLSRLVPTTLAALAVRLLNGLLILAAPQYVVCDRDAVYGDIFIRRLRAMGIRDRPTAARSLGKRLAATVIAPLCKSFAATSLCGCGY